MKELFENSEKIVKNWAKAEKEYDNLLKRVKDEKGQKRREFVKELLEKNSIYMEELRINYMKIRAEILGRSIGISPNSKNKKPIMRNSQKCPNCSNIMNYVEYFDGYQCPECKKKYFLW
jgi:methionyl-tRNA synthetase